MVHFVAGAYIEIRRSTGGACSPSGAFSTAIVWQGRRPTRPSVFGESWTEVNGKGLVFIEEATIVDRRVKSADVALRQWPAAKLLRRNITMFAHDGRGRCVF